MKLFYYMLYDNSGSIIKASLSSISNVSGTIESLLENRKSQFRGNSYAHFTGVLEFETDTDVDSGPFWIVFYNNGVFDDLSNLKFVGQSYEECLDWWNENWEEYAHGYCPEEGEEGQAPELEPSRSENAYTWSDGYSSIRIEEVYLI